MDFGHNQRFGTTLGLSEGSGVVPLLVFKIICVLEIPRPKTCLVAVPFA